MDDIELMTQIKENSKKIDEGIAKLKEIAKYIEELTIQDRIRYEEFMLKHGGKTDD